jgi:hypothetical protein
MSTNNPTFDDIVSLLNTLVPLDDSNIQNAPHAAFWRGKTRDQFVAIKTDDWGVPGNLVAPGNVDKSNLYLALSGKDPFDGTLLPQMPDTSRDPNSTLAKSEQLAMVATWINNNAPAGLKPPQVA